MDFTQEIIARALEVLQAEGNLLYPTDTIWGIGCDARSSKAVETIYSLKKRLDSKALICLVKDFDMLTEYVGRVDKILLPYLEDIRPTTVIYPQVQGLSQHLCAQDGSIGIRIAKDTFCQSLISALGAPLVSTSANISGQESPQNFEEITPEILEGVDHVVPLKQKQLQVQASRIIRLLPSGKIAVLRP